MTTRTLKFYGKGYGTADTSIAVTLDGTTVYTGTVTTVNSSTVEYLPEDQVELFTCEVPVDFDGSKPMSVEVTAGTLFLNYIKTNYTAIPNPVFTTAELEVLGDPTASVADRVVVFSAHATPPFTTEELAILSSEDLSLNPQKKVILFDHGVSTFISSGSTVFSQYYAGDEKVNVEIDGVAQVKPDPIPSESAGDWGYVVEENSTITFDLIITNGME